MRARSHVLPALIVALAAPAFAQPSESSRLFEEGRELAKQNKWAEACARFEQSLAIEPAPGTKLNLGDCLEKQGEIRRGWQLFEEAARDFERASDPRAKFAHDRATAAAAKLATLVIKVTDASRAGLAIRIGDRAAAPRPELVERVDPGTLAVTVTAPNADPFTRTVTAVAGHTIVVDVPALAEPRVAPTPVVVARDDRRADRRRPRVLVAIGLGVAGGMSLAGSGILGLLAKSQYDGAFDDGACTKTDDGNSCTPAGKSEIDAAVTKGDLATGFLVGGVALVAAGAIVYLTAPEERGISVAPMASSSTAGVMLGGRF